MLPKLELIQQQFEGCDRQVFLEEGSLPNRPALRRLWLDESLHLPNLQLLQEVGDLNLLQPDRQKPKICDFLKKLQIW